MSAEKDELLAQAHENDANYEERVRTIKYNDLIDSKYGFERYTGAAERSAWLVNIQPSEMVDDQSKQIIAGVDFYFLEESGQKFKICYPFRPYLYIATTEGNENMVAAFLTKKYGSVLMVEHLLKEDLDLKNHLSGLRRSYIKLSFPSMNEHSKLKKDLFPVIRKNKDRIKRESQYSSYLARNMGGDNYAALEGDVLAEIVDIREYDLPYHMRVAIDEKIFVGKWYSVKGITMSRKPSIIDHPTLIDPVDPVVLAFDIETTKLPLKFPDAANDEIMMISYMVDGHGFLIINRDIVSTDVEGFEFTPKEEYKGDFTVWNEVDETALIRRFFDHILEVQPNIIVTYNGDIFDWPFVETRATIRGINMAEELGFAKDSSDEYKCRNCIHMDAFRWVKRDSYLPVGSQNLKAVAKAKLRYDPVEVDPEDMCKMAREDPQSLANYSVSDAVATYYLYMKYVHPFVFALCTIIPLGPDDVLRKGSGTLCEALLMVEAFHNQIIFPNKYTESEEVQMTANGHRIESETYVGGHVEALEAGVFRADIPCRFRLVPTALARLRDEVPDTLEKELMREYGIPLENVVDFEEQCKEVQEAFTDMLNIPSRMEPPRIYHLDVGAMYPNIILTNRLQPCAMVNEEICMACSYNAPDAKCKRSMAWEWRGELTPATRGEYQQIMQQLEGETFGKPPKAFHQLTRDERQAIEKKRVQEYSRKAYGKNRITKNEMRNTTICQRENAFYVDTVKAFRDRRYDYKELLKKAKGALDEVPKDDVGGQKVAQGRVVLYESLQLAHKCILNSFYGYVMRKGSRWFSMEMAGIVCHTGANIITEARKLVEQIGKPLELDTDGIWCLIPSSFPENVTFKLQNHKKKTITVSYPGAMLNSLVNQSFTNDQYHTLQEDGSYTISSENSIFFEVDGPYQCMVLPASKEEGKKLKKRYAVFNPDGSLAELKGFEVKRRGELNIIKHFQTTVFKAFLRGSNLEEVYENVAREADYWLDVLFSRGVDLEDTELFDLISENRSMQRKLADYGTQKSTSISTAKRLAEFLGDDMVKDRGLACRFVISRHPIGSPVTERAIPVAIFQADPKTCAHYLRLWTKQNIAIDNVNIRDMLDWDYYVERLGSCIQKIITIPAALQGVSNPVPRIAHPDWLDNKIKNRFDALRQPKITDLFKAAVQVSPAESSSAVTNGNGKRTLEERDGMEWEEGNKENEPKRSRAAEAGKNKASEPAPMVKKTLGEHGFDEWLSFLKVKWREGKKQRKLAQRDRGATAVDRMMQNTRNRVKEKTWQVLSIEENPRSPGYFSLWAAVDGQMNKFSLRVERAILLNAMNKKDGKNTIRRILPHHKDAHFLYEYKTDEAEFQSLLAVANAELCSAEVEGVYESQTPLLFRALCSIGCICMPSAPPVAGSYSLESLPSVSPSSKSFIQSNYLTDMRMRTVFLYKYTQDTRQVWCVIDCSTKEGCYFVVNRGDVSMPNMDRVYTTLFEEQKSKNPDRETGDALRGDVSFDVRQFGSAKDCEKEVGKLLRASREATARPTILAMLVNEDTASLTKAVPNISLFPHVRLHVKEPIGLLNQLNWQRSTAERAVKNFFNSFLFLDMYAKWARFLNIPIGNVPSDAPMLALDLLFARQLIAAGHVLWASPSTRPDLGGKELDDLRLSVDWNPLSKDHSVLLNRKCFSHDACVELELGAVAVTALVQRGRLLEAEGGDDTVAFDSTAALPGDAVLGLRNTISAYDEGATVDAVLKVLKGLLADFVRCIAMDANTHADEVVMTLSRWLHSPSALLFDPAVTRSVSVLERKLVLLLSAEIERLGGKVIHATPSRLILSTGRNGCSSADSFADMLIRSLGNNPLFAALTIRKNRVWDALLWRDGYNFTGVGEVVETESVVDELGDEQLISTRKPVTHTMWRIADDLPESGGLHQEFLKTVSGFVLLYVRKHAEMQFDVDSGTSFRSDVIDNRISQRMFQIVDRLMKGGGGGVASDGTGDEAVENGQKAAMFNETVHAALSCDTGCEQSADGLRESVRRMLDGCQAPPPSSSLFLANLFCPQCGQAADVDVADEEAGKCGGCQEDRSKSDVDNAVAERLNRQLTAYLMQDHVCGKCKAVRSDSLSTYCECSGPFSNSISSDDLARDVAAALAVASRMQLPRAEELARWIASSL